MSNYKRYLELGDFAIPETTAQRYKLSRHDTVQDDQQVMFTYLYYLLVFTLYKSFSYSFSLQTSGKINVDYR